MQRCKIENRWKIMYKWSAEMANPRKRRLCIGEV